MFQSGGPCDLPLAVFRKGIYAFALISATAERLSRDEYALSADISLTSKFFAVPFRRVLNGLVSWTLSAVITISVKMLVFTPVAKCA